MSDKRIFTRMNETKNIKIKTENDENAYEVKNLSLGGLAIDKNSEMNNEKETVKASLILEEDNLAEVEIELVHKGEEAIGFRFKNLSIDALNKIKNELSKKCANEKDIANQYFWVKLHQD